MEAQLVEVSFEGSYFDTHAHWQNNSIVSAYPSFMEEYDIGASVLFSPSQTAKTDYRSFLEQLTDPGATYLPFMAAPPPGYQFSAAAFEELYEGKKAAFAGIGEWKHRQNPPAFTEEPLASIFELAGRLDIPIMYHPFPAQEGTIEDGLSTYTETTFLLHGFQMTMMGERTRSGTGDLLPRLLREYDNLYWTADVATMLGGKLFESQSAAEFVEWYDSDQSQENIDRYRAILPELLDAAPNRVMWGTDVAFDWHMEDAVISRMMDATDRILEAVPEDRHDPYTHQNAVELFDL